MQTLSIDIAEYKTRFRPGQDLNGALHWNLPENPKSIEISLFWRTEGRGTQDIGVIETKEFENPAQSGQEAFNFKIPPQPYSFKGKLISIIWALEATAYPTQQTIRQQITISPTGQEVVLK